MATIKQIKLPGVTNPYDLAVNWTNIDDKPTILTSSDVDTAINNKLAANDAMLFKGTIGTNGTITQLPATHQAGWTYKVITANTYAGQVCEVGDTIICITDGNTANNNHWAVIQTNIDGSVIGPSSSSANNVAVFTGTTGKVIKDSGFTIGKSVPSNAVFTDTHYASNLLTTSSITATTQVTSATTDPWLNLIENGEIKNPIHLVGQGATTINTSSSGKTIYINSTDTTYTSKSASSGGTAVSLVTTGEKYTWNNKGNYNKPIDGIPDTDLSLGVQYSLDNINKTYSSTLKTTLGIGNQINFSAPSDGLPINELYITIRGSQKGDGDPTPNIRNITSFEYVSIYQSPTSSIDDAQETSFYVGNNDTGNQGVYNGTFHPLTGILNVDSYAIRIRYLTWTYDSNNVRFMNETLTSIIKPAATQSTLLDGLLCECYTPHAVTSLPNNNIGVTNNGKILIKDTRYTTVNDFINNMGDYYIVYPLNETLTLTKESYNFTTLFGTNYFWSNSGNITIEYHGYAKALTNYINNVKASIPRNYKETFTLDTSWSGSGPYTHWIPYFMVSPNAKVDLQPDATVISQMVSDGVQALYAVNDNGWVTVYAVGAAPTATLTMQCTVTEVDV